MVEEDLVRAVERLKRTDVGKTVNSRIAEFDRAGKDLPERVFSELCFCILTANCSAERGISAQNEIGPGFIDYPEAKLRAEIRRIVCRFYNNKTRYIISARHKRARLSEILKSFSGKIAREGIVAEFKGLGMKEASHFLRNIGYKDVAIIDFHIIDILERAGLILRPKTMTKKAYLGVEKMLEALAEKTETTLAELDLYLWYLETGKVLK